MADKAGIAPGLHTGVMDNVITRMAFRAIVHLHAIPAIVLEPGDARSPYIPAVSGDAVFFVRFETVRCTDVTVAGYAVHFGTQDMGGVGKKDAIRLTGINPPRHFTALGDILRKEEGLILTLSLHLFVASKALSQSR